MSNLVDKIEFDRRFDVNLAENPTEPLKKAVVEFLAQRQVVVEFPADWSWEWTLGPNPTGFSGNIPKRISKLRYQQHGKRIEVKVQSDLGEMFQRILPKQELMTIDFTRDLNWRSGDFGDRTSCFFTSGPSAGMREFRDWGGFAVRQWLNDKGVGRALVAAYKDVLAVFNAYPMDRDEYGHSDASAFARPVAHLLGTDCLRTSMAAGNRGYGSYSKGGHFYTTSYGYLVGPLDVIKPLAAAGVSLGVE